MRRLAAIARTGCLIAGLSTAIACGGSHGAALPLQAAHRRALADSLATLFDSISSIHRGSPDTGLLRRLHPPDDSLQYVEGTALETMTGDSLFRRVRSLHRPVHAMTQRFLHPVVLPIDADHAVLSATETVEWVDDTGPHRYEGILTVVAARRGEGWVIRAYRGS